MSADATEPGAGDRATDALSGAAEVFAEMHDILTNFATTPLDQLVGPQSAPALPAGFRALADSIRADLPLVIDRFEVAVARAQRLARYSPEGVGRVADRVAVLASRPPRPGRGPRRPGELDESSRLLAVEFLGAVRAGATDGAASLVERVAETPAASAMAALLEDLTRAIDAEDFAAGALACAALDERLAGVRHDSGRTRDALDFLAVLSAMLLVGTGQTDLARDRLARRAAAAPSARMLAECCHLDLYLERLGDAEAAARSAVDRGHSEVSGYVALGAVMETVGDLGDALGLYREGLLHADLEWLEAPGAASILSPTGLLLREIAPRLMSAGLPGAALAACREARTAGVQGPERYPDMDAFLLEATILRSTTFAGLAEDDHRQQLASAACEAGSRLLWSETAGDLDQAVDQLTVATELTEPGEQPLAGWLLAESLRRRAWAISTPPDPVTMREADRAWGAWDERAAQPSAADAWVYESGANISEDVCSGLYRPLGRTLPETWEGLRRTERALDLDPGDPEIWVLRSRLLDTAGLGLLARVSVDEALGLDPDHVGALVARTVHLTGDGRFAEALRLARSLDAEVQDRAGLLMAWLEVRCGDAEACLHRLAGIEDSPWDPQARDMALVTAHLALDHVPDAVAALRDLVAKPAPDVASELRAVRGHALLGDLARATSLAPTQLVPAGAPDAADLATTRLVLAICADDRAEALRLVDEVVDKLDSPADHRDVLLHVSEWAALLGSDPGRSDQARLAARSAEVLAGLAPRPARHRLEWLEQRRRENADDARALAVLDDIEARDLARTRRRTPA